MGQSLVDRFFSKVDIRGEDECWEWQAGTDEAGYGRFRYNGEKRLAHRVAFEFFFGPIPEGMVVRHKVCDNPKCQNPRHLELGSQGDNVDDMISKGRQAKGDKHGRAILTSAEVDQIKVMDRELVNHKDIADIFGVSQSHVCNILQERCWASA